MTTSAEVVKKLSEMRGAIPLPASMTRRGFLAAAGVSAAAIAAARRIRLAFMIFSPENVFSFFFPRAFGLGNRETVSCRGRWPGPLGVLPGAPCLRGPFLLLPHAVHPTAFTLFFPQVLGCNFGDKKRFLGPPPIGITAYLARSAA